MWNYNSLDRGKKSLYFYLMGSTECTCLNSLTLNHTIEVCLDQNCERTEFEGDIPFLSYLKNSKSPGQLQTALTRLKPTECNSIKPSSFPHTKQSQFSPFHSKFEKFSATYLEDLDQSQNNSSNSFWKKVYT